MSAPLSDPELFTVIGERTVGRSLQRFLVGGVTERFEWAQSVCRDKQAGATGGVTYRVAQLVPVDETADVNTQRFYQGGAATGEAAS